MSRILLLGVDTSDGNLKSYSFQSNEFYYSYIVYKNKLDDLYYIEYLYNSNKNKYKENRLIFFLKFHTRKLVH